MTSLNTEMGKQCSQLALASLLKHPTDLAEIIPFIWLLIDGLPLADTQQMHPKYSLFGFPILALWLGNPLHVVIWGHYRVHRVYVPSLGASCGPKSGITVPFLLSPPVV